PRLRRELCAGHLSLRGLTAPVKSLEQTRLQPFLSKLIQRQPILVWSDHTVGRRARTAAARGPTMPDLRDGESIEMQGSGSRPYVLKNVGGVYSCTCPAWLNQSLAIERRTCKHLRKLRGDAAEEARIGSALPATPREATSEAQAPPLLLAESWDGVADPAGWWLSEKLDGVRAYWDGKQFLSRLGNLYHAPDWFIAGLPNVPLDGELWLGRKQFQRTVSIARRQDKSDHWSELSFVVFDAPVLNKDFETRMAFVAECMVSKPQYARALDQQLCHGLDHLRAELTRLDAHGAEG